MADENSDSRGEARHSYFAKQQMVNSARTAFQQLSALLKNRTLYPESHPIMLTAADKLRNKILELLVGRKEVVFYMVGGELFFDKMSILIDQGLSQMIEHFKNRDVGGIAFKTGVTSDDLIRFSSMMNKEAAFFASIKDINKAVINEQIKHIELHRVLLVDKITGSAIKGKQKASEIFKDAVDILKDMVQGVQLDRTANVRKTNTIVQAMVDNILNNRDVFLGLTNIKMYDEYTFAHSVNVSILAVSLATFLSLEKPQIAALGIAGLMHDIGKVNIPSDIINKPGKLNDEEWEAVKRHPVEGALVLAGTRGISKLAMIAAFEHHQHGDSGYPKIDGERRQHPFSQIITLVDAYEAITAPRVYYNAQTPPDQGVRILLKKRGNPFNAVLVNAFVRMIGVFPIGSVLKLDTGEMGLVMHQTSDLMRPRVLILSKLDGSEKEGGLAVSLLETRNGRYKRSVAGTIDPHEANLDLKKYFD